MNEKIRRRLPVYILSLVFVFSTFVVFSEGLTGPASVPTLGPEEKTLSTGPVARYEPPDGQCYAAAYTNPLDSTGLSETYDEFEARVRESAPTITIESIELDGQDGNIGDTVSVTVTGEVLNIEIPMAGSWPIQMSSSATLRIEQ